MWIMYFFKMEFETSLHMKTCPVISSARFLLFFVKKNSLKNAFFYFTTPPLPRLTHHLQLRYQNRRCMEKSAFSLENLNHHRNLTCLCIAVFASWLQYNSIFLCNTI